MFRSYLDGFPICSDCKFNFRQILQEAYSAKRAIPMKNFKLWRSNVSCTVDSDNIVQDYTEGGVQNSAIFKQLLAWFLKLYAVIV